MTDNGSVMKKTTINGLRANIVAGQRFQRQRKIEHGENVHANELEIVRDDVITMFAKKTMKLNGSQRRCVAKQLSIAFGIVSEKLDG